MLRLSKVDGALGLTWGASCIATDDDYAIYEGVLGAYYSHGLVVCSTGGVPQIELTAGNGSRYYLVVPRNATNEGSLGRTSDGLERPQGSPACTSQSVAVCP